jgi:ABC-2 type transport system ATP-binding protein
VTIETSGVSAQAAPPPQDSLMTADRPEVASTELDEKNGRITAFPAPGKLPLAPINALAERQHWPLAELHLESGRLDEVFRSITGGAAA